VIYDFIIIKNQERRGIVGIQSADVETQRYYKSIRTSGIDLCPPKPVFVFILIVFLVGNLKKCTRHFLKFYDVRIFIASEIDFDLTL